MSTKSVIDLKSKNLYLASKSPRRSQLFEMLGFDFDIVESKVDEKEETYTIPEVHVLELAQKKALKVAENINDGFIVGADTIVVLDNQIIEKPADRKEAKEMLQRLSGRTHTVYTGYAIVEKPSGSLASSYERTFVSFRRIENKEIDRYIDVEPPLDKAGAYGIQDQSSIFVERVEGCFYNVVGFPVTKFYETMRQFVQQFAY